MTKQERIERRLANKAKRQERKKLRKDQFNDLINNVKNTPDFPEDGSTPDFMKNFPVYWPLVKSALIFVESSKLSRPKMDLQIQHIIELGDSIVKSPDASTESEFLTTVKKTWRIIRTILIAITIFITNDNKDDKIDKLIEIGDWLCGLDGDD